MSVRSTGWVRAAAVVSAVGHPVVTASLFVAAVSFSRYPPAQAGQLTAGVIGGVLLPFAAWVVYRTRRGAYTNYDVSDRRQRHTMYPVLLGLLGVGVAAAWLTRQPRPMVTGLAVAWGVAAAAALVNTRLKCSLHAAMSFFLAGAAGLITPWMSGVGLVVAVLVSASRLVLARHTLPEVLAGAGLGLGGAVALYALL